MKGYRILAVFKKQAMDIPYMRGILIQFFIYPLFLSLFQFSQSEQTKMLIMSIMATFFIGSSPILIVSSIIREDKYSGALKSMMLASVRPLEYMIGTGLVLLIVAIPTSMILGFMAGYPLLKYLYFIAILMVGITLTTIIGCSISMQASNGTNAMTMLSLLSMANGFIPVLEMIYPSTYNVTKFWYTQQIKRIIIMLYTEFDETTKYGFLIVGINMVVILFLFVLSYRKNRVFKEIS